MRQLSLNDLCSADVLLFSPEENSFISQAITFLTNANVSHAALYFHSAPPAIIEETPPQISESPAEKRFRGRTIHVYRHTSAPFLDPVITAAGQHLNNQEPYDHSGLYMVGLLLMYKKFSMTSKKQRAVIRILKKLTTTFTRYIQKRQTPGKHPMTCSQFVAQCFDDAGAAFRLQFSPLPLDDSASDETLLDKVTDWMVQNPVVKGEYGMTNITESDTSSDEDLCEELCNALNDKTPQSNVSITGELAEAVYLFAEAHAALINLDTEMKNDNPLAVLRSNNNMFVSPGDLKNCSNLTSIGSIQS
ncbi:hypothetical protein HI972_004975 [Salmonella enterica]|nr:hypothetical protein [Salmonella enterica]